MFTYPRATMRQTRYIRWRDVSTIAVSIALWVLPVMGQVRNPDPNLLTASQKVEVGEAIRALRKIASITKAGVNQREYSSRVLDMVATVDESVRNIPDSHLKERILIAKDTYVNVMNNWPRGSSALAVIQREVSQIGWETAEIAVRQADDLFQASRLNRETNER